MRQAQAEMGSVQGSTHFEGDDMAPANDIKAARATYEGFVNLIKISVPVIVVIVAFVVYLIH